MKENITVGTIPQTPKQEPFWKLFGIGFVYTLPLPLIGVVWSVCSGSFIETLLMIPLFTLFVVLPLTLIFYVGQKPLKEEEKPIGMRYPWEHPKTGIPWLDRF